MAPLLSPSRRQVARILNGISKRGACMPRSVPSVTVAQFRMLQRLKAGLVAPVSRYHTGTIRALERKALVDCALAQWAVAHDHASVTMATASVWFLTPLAAEVFATKGRGKP